ncbi:hypothetical protein [Sporolactobacillus spathodeae]|uniref:Uncharacterized protein n=1 Tax=Sporolactobacillus spathodeae TaxID=1465502 RepID=A0ABS2QA07_9BACL|nr:hypothetical protein [Sporolactobacillus spathodeae]MBM7658623.1 hypothetical protein [Sporolactobacillus spathodeae]
MNNIIFVTFIGLVVNAIDQRIKRVEKCIKAMNCGKKPKFMATFSLKGSPTFDSTPRRVN